MHWFLTGSTGFIGQALLLRLLHEGHRVSCLGRSALRMQAVVPASLTKKLHIIEADLLAADAVRQAMLAANPDVVLHLAGVATLAGGESEADLMRINMVSTANMLAAATACSIRLFMHASSTKAYASTLSSPLSEADAGSIPSDIYGASKAAADVLCQSFYRSHALPTLCLRFANVYGPNDANTSRLIPGAIQRILSKQAPVLKSNRYHAFDFIYLHDVLDALILLAERDVSSAHGQVLNLGSGEAHSIGELVELLIALSDTSLAIRFEGDDDAQKAVVRYMDHQRLTRLLDWQAKTSLRSGLALCLKA